MNKMMSRRIGLLVLGLLLFGLACSGVAMGATKGDVIKLASTHYDAATAAVRAALAKFADMNDKANGTQLKRLIDEFKERLSGLDPAMQELVVELKKSPSSRDKLRALAERLRIARGGMQETLQIMRAHVGSEKNKRMEFMTMFENFDQKTNQLFNILSTVQKQTKELADGLTRNLL